MVEKKYDLAYSFYSGLVGGFISGVLYDVDTKHLLSISYTIGLVGDINGNKNSGYKTGNSILFSSGAWTGGTLVGGLAGLLLRGIAEKNN